MCSKTYYINEQNKLKSTEIDYANAVNDMFLRQN